MKAGVQFFDTDGNVAYEILENKRNLKQLEILKEGCVVGRIEKKITININPIADIQRYAAWVHSADGVVTVKDHNASTDLATWRIKEKFLGGSLVLDEAGNEIGKLYSLGEKTFVLDFMDSVDPVQLLLSLMAVKIRTEELDAKRKD